ncbi:hypothetical protein DIPPA_00944 [Diplonema papillatum]|nr:hypothetical protein DIPPA_00944 [Diplonema papillatum]
MGEERTEPVVDTEQGKAPEPAHQDSCRDRIRNWWATTQARWFSKVGATIATNPLPFIAIPVLLFIAFGFGITNAKLTTDAMELWVQKGSRLEDELDFYEDYFYGLGGYVAVQATPKQEGDNMMDRKYLDEMYAIDAELLDMRKHRNPRWEIIGNCATTTDAALCNDLARPFCGWDEDTNTCIFMDGFGLFPSYLQKQAITIDYLGVKWGYRELCEEVRVPTPTATNQSSVLEAARTPCSKQFTPQDCFAEHPYTQQAKTLNLLRWPENHPYSVDDAATLGKAFAEPCKMWQESFNSKGYVLGNPEYTEAGDEVTKISAYKWLYPLYEEKGFADKVG